MAQKTRSTSIAANLIGVWASVIAWILVGFTGVGFLGGLWWVFDLIAHFRVQYAALLVPAGAVLLGVRWRRTAAIVGIAFLVNLALIVPLYLTSPVAPRGSDAIDILSFNVTASNPNRTAVIEYLAVSGADIFFVHESSTDWEAAIGRSDLPYRMVNAREPGSVFGTLALVREEMVARVLALGDFGQLSIEVTADLDGREIKVLGTHPLSPVSRARSMARDDQLREIGKWAAGQDVPVVVAGDLNASTWSHGFSLAVNEAELVNSQRGFGIQPSWPAGHPLFAIPIDHLLHSPDLTTVDRKLGESLGSDHFALLVAVTYAEA